MQLGLRPRLQARPSLVDLIEQARSPPASAATETLTASLEQAQLDEATTVQALDQPLPTSPTTTELQPSSPPLSTPTISFSIAEAVTDAKGDAPAPEKTVKMPPVRAAAREPATPPTY